MLEHERDQVAAAGRRLAAEGLVAGTAGNLSLRAGDRVAVSAAGAVLATLEPAQVTVVDLDGRALAGDAPPTSELDLHLGVYRRFGAGAVVHAHPPFATTLSCVLDEVPAVHYLMAQLGGPLRVAAYATPGTPALAEAVLAALEGRSAALMANHGTVAHGPALDEAVERTALVEWLCAVHWRAAALGAPRPLSPEDLAAASASGARSGERP